MLLNNIFFFNMSLLFLVTKPNERNKTKLALSISLPLGLIVIVIIILAVIFYRRSIINNQKKKKDLIENNIQGAGLSRALHD